MANAIRSSLYAGVTMEYQGVSPEGKLHFSYTYSQAYQVGPLN